MKRLILGCMLIFAVGCLVRSTRFRKDFRNCASDGGGAILCSGKPAAQVECFQPRSDACTALALRYTDGERVWLFQPVGFDPDNPEASPSEEVALALQPEMARDASLIWFKRSTAPLGVWETFELATGLFEQVDATRVLRLRNQQMDGPIPLWNLGK